MRLFLISLLLFCSLHAELEFEEDHMELQNEKLEFSEEFQNYFNNELSLPNNIDHYDESLDIDNPHVKIESDPDLRGGWKLIFTFPREVFYKRQIRANSIVIEFNQSVDSKDLERVAEKLSYLSDRFVTGYSTIEIDAKENVNYKTDKIGNIFILKLTLSEEALQKESLPLQIARARLQVEKRHYKNAASLLEQIEKKDPNSKEMLVVRASLEGLQPCWQKEMQTLKSLQVEYPYDEGIDQIIRETYTPHSTYVLAEEQYQDTLLLAKVWANREQSEQIVFKNGNQTLYLGEQFQLWYGNIKSINNNQGNSVRFRGAREQGTIYLRNKWLDGSHLLASVYGQKDVVGGGLEYGLLWPDIQGDFTISAIYNRPYWLVFETLAYNGREDLVYAKINSVINRYINLQIGGGPHLVGITGTPVGFFSTVANGELFLNFFITNPILAFNYSYDAEYVFFDKVKTGVTGNLYNPVPYTSFEFHSFRLYFYYQLKKSWFITLSGGETVNRLGINTPIWGVDVKYLKICPYGLEFNLSAYQFPSTTNAGYLARFFTATLTARF